VGESRGDGRREDEKDIEGEGDGEGSNPTDVGLEKRV
jgi:hypothetical protein